MITERHRILTCDWRRKIDEGFQWLKKRAEVKGLQWDLTFEDYRDLVMAPCWICSMSSRPVRPNKLRMTKPHLGFTLSNIITLCGKCCVPEGFTAVSACVDIVKGPDLDVNEPVKELLKDHEPGRSFTYLPPFLDHFMCDIVTEPSVHTNKSQAIQVLKPSRLCTLGSPSCVRAR